MRDGIRSLGNQPASPKPPDDEHLVPDELKCSENLVFNQAVAELQDCDHFFGAWHHAQIQYDLSNYTGSVWIDAQPVLSAVPLNTELKSNVSPEISVEGAGDLSVKLWLDDLVIKFQDKSAVPRGTEEPDLQTLVKDDFNKYESGLFPRNGGWVPRLDVVESEEQDTPRRVTQDTEGGFRLPATSASSGKGVTAFVDETEYASRTRSFRFAVGDAGPAYAGKRISLPPRVPFAVSEENFIIAESFSARGERPADRDSGLSGEGGRLGKQNPISSDAGSGRASAQGDPDSGRIAQRGGHPSRPASGNRDPAKAFSVSPAGGSYYFYSFDGKPLAEYNAAGVCVRDYIYMGNQLIAEYDPLSSQYYYYTSDQINSTRIVTDGTGAVVYAAAHDPYGGIQKTWVTTFDPVPKFSGKERDGESQLDYFGARYYDRSQYRFISTDPIISTIGSLHNPQMMNLYSFCINNSTSNMDPDGRGVIPVQLPGVNGTTLTSWLDARFAQRVEAFIAFCEDIGIEIEVTSAYRSQEDQDNLVAKGLTKAKTSLHSAGWAIDINWNAFGSNELVEISVITAAAINGIDWGGYFRDPDVVHFYAEPSEDRATLIKCAIATIETYYAFGVGGLSDRELYMLYGVFTADAAYKVIDAAVDILKN